MLRRGIRLLSDLHAECYTECPLSKYDLTVTTKYCVLAGDITNFPGRTKHLPRIVRELRKVTEQNIIYVLGNHEYYRCKDHETVVPEFKKLCAELGVDFLENQSVVTEDYTFYGATMWTNPDDVAFSMMSDKESMKSRLIVERLHNESISELEKFMDDYPEDAKPLVVVTHHLPDPRLIDEKYRPWWFLNSGFAGELASYIRPPVRCWMYGHTHTPNQVKFTHPNHPFKPVQMLCNPGGYPKEGVRRADCIWELTQQE